MRLKNYLFLLCIWGCCLGRFTEVNAQSQLGFGAFTLNKDTLNIGDTLLITSYVNNFDTAAYNDNISFGLQINGVQNVNNYLFPKPYYDQVVSINAGDSLVAKMQIIITHAYFDIGPDILVVWPIARDGSEPLFRIDTTIYVREKGVGIRELQNNSTLKVYCNNNSIQFRGLDSIETLNRVSIFDMAGRKIYETITTGNSTVPFSFAAHGVYLVVVQYNTGETDTYKVIK